MIGTILYIAVIFSTCIIITLLLLRKKKARADSSFLLFLIVANLWILSNYLYTLNFQYETVLFILRSSFALGAVLIYTLFNFSLFFPINVYKKSKLISILSTIPLCLAFLLSFTNTYVTGFYVDESGIVVAEFSEFSFIYAILAIPFFIATYINMGIQYRKSKGIVKQQLKFLFLGTFFAAFSIMFTDIIIPIFFSSYAAANFGSLAIFFIVIFASYAIFKHHLFDIRAITSELFAFFIVLIFIIELVMSDTVTEYIIRIIGLIIISFFSYFLIRSVLTEIKKTREVQKLSNSIIKKNRHLKKLLKMRSEFLDIASHQLRTPVSSIKGILSMWKSGDLDHLPKEKREKFINNAYIKVLSLENITNDILSASEMDTDKFNIKPTDTVDPDSLLSNIATLSEKDALDKGLYLKYIKPKTKLPKVLISKQYLSQAIGNLIDNSIKYTKEGGITIKPYQKKNKLFISISDTGIGIPKESQNKLFDKFYRADNASKIRANGSGLGLFIVKKIIEGHPNGKIDVESTLDKGTTFTITLPINKNNDSDVKE